MPYLLALATFLYLFYHQGIYFDFELSRLHLSIPVHLLGLQVLFYPQVAQVITLWYIGLVAIFYAIYPFLHKCRDIRRFIVACTGVLLSFLMIRYLTRMVDIRLFLYLPVFFLGILAARYELDRKLLSWNPLVYVPLALGVVVGIRVAYEALS